MIHELSRRSAREVPGCELRGVAGHALRIGNLRVREGRVHRRTGPQAGPARTGQRRHAVSRRDRRHVAHRTGQAPARARRAPIRTPGRQKSISVDFRLISATNRPLEQFVRDGRFREDLYYRVNAFAIRLPSLRERRVDIPVLAQRFLARYCAAQGLPPDSKVFTKEALDQLLIYPWPGQYPRARKHGVARGALCARPLDPCARYRVPEYPRSRSRRPRADRLPSLAEAERAHISGCWTRCTGTRRKLRACSTSAAEPCTGRLPSTRPRTRAACSLVPLSVLVAADFLQ